jgi:hypothetical protein
MGRRFYPSDLTEGRHLDCGQFFVGDRSADRPIPGLIVSQFPSSARKTRFARCALCAQRSGQRPRNARRSPPETTYTAPGKHGPTPHFPVLLPSPNMGDRQPLHEPRKFTITLRPQQQVPVIQHHCICTDPHRRFIKSLAQDLLERLMVRGPLAISDQSRFLSFQSRFLSPR